MPINKAVLAAFKAATRLRPDIKEFYKAQRVAEDLSARLALPNPRCRVDDITAPMPDGCALPLRVFTPLDIDFSLAEGFKVTEDFRCLLYTSEQPNRSQILMSLSISG